MNKYNTFVDGSDLSNRCVKCGSEAVVHRVMAKLQYAPFWATYLALGGGLLRVFYRGLFREGSLRLGFCKKHKGMGDLRRDISVVSAVIFGVGLIAYGMKIQNVAMQLVGCLAFIVFFFFIKSGNIVKVKNIKNGQITIKTKLEGNA